MVDESNPDDVRGGRYNWKFWTDRRDESTPDDVRRGRYNWKFWTDRRGIVRRAVASAASIGTPSPGLSSTALAASNPASQAHH
jgi:hypothetical protein